MKLLIVFLFLATTSICTAQTDSIFVEKADGTITGYAVSAIREITFSGLVTTVREQELVQNVLTSFALHQNYPNPFNPSTTIQYDIPHSGDVTITIYDIQGRLVRSLSSQNEQAGRHATVWDGRNDRGVSVSSGSYFCRVDFNKTFLVRKLVLLK
jgi:hypothetical protein